MIKQLFKRFKKADAKSNNSNDTKKSTNQSANLTRDYKKNEELIRNIFDQCDDIKYRRLKIPAFKNLEALVVFVDGLVNDDIINRDIIGKLIHPFPEPHSKIQDISDLVSVSQTLYSKNIADISNRVLMGEILILTEKSSEGLLLESRLWPARSIQEPEQERTIRGPREGFSELAKTNMALIRRRLPTPSLKSENMSLGRRTFSSVYLAYIKDVADNSVVNEIRKRIKSIDIDGLVEPGSLAELIIQPIYSPFPLQFTSERPDKVVGELLQGKTVIIIDGSPFVIILPVTFNDFYKSPEDYYMNPYYATLGRLLRFLCIFISTTMTAAYIAVISFHYEMIPGDIIVFIAETRAEVPFSPFTEAIILELAVELIREASLRLPGTIGPTIGIVGALILGQAIVEARLVSPVLLIIVAASLMANFTITNYEAALTLRYLRFPIIVAASFL